MKSTMGLAALLLCWSMSAAAGATGPDGPFAGTQHPAGDFRWTYDGTRAALDARLQQLAGQQKNPFGPLHGGAEGMLPPGSALLGDFLTAVIGIPGPAVALPGDTWFYSGAEAHNAGREAAVITQGRSGAVLLVAVLQGSYLGGKHIDEMTILAPAGQAVDPANEAALARWARGEIDASNAIIKDSALAQPIVELVIHKGVIGA